MFIIVDIFAVFVYNNKHGGDILEQKECSYHARDTKRLSLMGEQIKYARLRRKLSVELVAERAGISRTTLWNIEKGASSVAIGAYAAVLHALNDMDKDLLLIAKDDELGRKLQDLDLPVRKRSEKGDK